MTFPLILNSDSELNYSSHKVCPNKKVIVLQHSDETKQVKDQKLT
jgi:hypothetical protein